MGVHLRWSTHIGTDLTWNIRLGWKPGGYKHSSLFCPTVSYKDERFYKVGTSSSNDMLSGLLNDALDHRIGLGKTLQT